MGQISFLSLFAAVAASFFSLIFIPNKAYRWIALLIGSMVFYWFINDIYILWLLGYSFLIFCFSFVVPLKKRKQNWVYYAGILISLLPLISFKIPEAIPFLSSRTWANIPLEYNAEHNTIANLLGVSFITFNAISYLADIRRGYILPERNYFIFLLYLSFFPYVLSGPLHRAKKTLAQIKNNIEIKSENLSLAFRSVLIGFFKNFVLAERFLAVNTDLAKGEATGLFIFLEGLSFFLYLYFVFSSFVDISCGIAKLFGIELETNFKNRVYAAPSRRKFWQGWHITLNHWFRDYVFFPMAKKIKGPVSTDVALFICFVLIGLWHGVSWAFLLWGCLNGLWILLEIKLAGYFSGIPIKIKTWAGRIYHLFFASLLALIFSTEKIGETFSRLLSPTWISSESLSILINQSFYLIFLFGMTDAFYLLIKEKKPEEYIGELRPILRWLIYFVVGFAILFFGVRMSIYNYYLKF